MSSDEATEKMTEPKLYRRIRCAFVTLLLPRVAVIQKILGSQGIVTHPKLEQTDASRERKGAITLRVLGTCNRSSNPC